MQTSQWQLVDLVRNYVLADDLDVVKRGALSIPDDDPFHAALRLFLQGRQTIESSWDYRKTLSFYSEALETLERAEVPEKQDRIVSSWLNRIISGHALLQRAESAWTLCNYSESKDAYLQASDLFGSAQKELGTDWSANLHSDFQNYSNGWQELALGMHHNILGCLLLREKKADEAIKQFGVARELLLKAESAFAKINNALGQHDARSYIVEDSVWQNQTMLFSNLTEMQWKDYVYFGSDSTFERLLATLPMAQIKFPSELLTRSAADTLKLFVADIGKITLSRIGDIQVPPVDVRVVFHPEYVLEIQYTLRLNTPIDAFMLYLLKVLNTEAVPTYDIVFQSDIASLSLTRDDGRLQDVSRMILETLIKRAKREDRMTFLDSFVVMRMYDYSPSVKASSLGRGNFRYMAGVFSDAETLTLLTSGNESHLPDNLFEDWQTGEVAAYLGQRFAVLVVPEMQDWEVKLYSEVVDYSVETRETITKILIAVQEEAIELRARLAVLREAVEGNSTISQREVRKLISSNLDIRLRALRLFDIRERHLVLKQSGIADVRLFSGRADEKLEVANQSRQAESQLERIEALYNTASNLGQDYLSLVIAVNSDISRRAFNVLNVIMMGTLGLAVATAILSTPISYTLAVLAVFATSFFGYLYLAYVRRSVTRLAR